MRMEYSVHLAEGDGVITVETRNDTIYCSYSGVLPRDLAEALVLRHTATVSAENERNLAEALRGYSDPAG